MDSYKGLERRVDVMGKKLTVKLGFRLLLNQFIAVILSFMSLGLLVLLESWGNAIKVIVGLMNLMVMVAPLSSSIWSEGWSDVNKNKLYGLKRNPFKGVIATAFPVLPGLIMAAVNTFIKSDVLYLVVYFYNFYLMPFYSMFQKNHTAIFIITLIDALLLFAAAYFAYYFGIRQRSPIHELMYGKNPKPKSSTKSGFFSKR